jgi:hypothetical protein
MTNEQGFDMAKSPEVLEKVSVTYLGTLGDLGLGNPDGIPSRLADVSREDLELYGEQLVASSKQITDYEHDACIDGRRRKMNCDGSQPEVRERHVSGSASNTEIAMNSGAPFVETINLHEGRDKVVSAIDAYVEAKTGKKRSAHSEGCGGANGAVLHNELIHSDPAPLGATEVFMNLPAIKALTGVTYDAELGDAVRAQALKTAQWLRNNSWDGQEYVDMVSEAEPAGVELLEGGDDTFHNHAEDAVVFDLRTGEVVTRDDVFVISVSAIINKAKAFAGNPDEAGYKSAYTQALIAGIAKHMAVAKVLPSTKTPVYLIG